MRKIQRTRLSRMIWFLFALPLAAIACRAVVPATPTSPTQPPALIQPTVIAIVPNQPEITVPQVVEDEQGLLITLYQRVNPSVVNITIFSQQSGNMTALGQGSGFVFDAAGNIITNAHVVHGADQIEVRFWDGSIRDAQLVGEDLHSDLAVIHIDNLPAGINPLQLGNMENVAVGETVVAIGNPFGLDGTLTRGIVSAIGRTIPALTSFSIPKAIQTDAPINPGNSGGPLLNLQGEVIGVNAQIETDGTSQANSGIGFAIPVSIVQHVVPELIATGKYDWAWLGVRGTSLTPIIANAMKLPVEKGAYITDVLADGPASKAGLQGSNDTQTVNGRLIPVGGDVIIAINGSPVNSFDDLLIYIALETTPGQDITLTVLRDGQQLEMPLKLELRPTTIQSETTPTSP